MHKLIAVGMRYRDAASVNKLKTDFKSSKSKNLPVQLILENNQSGVGGLAVKVIYSGTHVAYIRNADLSQLLEAVRSKSFKLDGYSITEVRENYLILQYQFQNSAGSTHTAISMVSPEVNVEVNSTKKETKMNVSNSMRDAFFREVKNVAIDIQSGKFGVTSAEGISVYVDGGISVNPITDFGVKIPAYAMRVAVKDLKEGDIVINGNEASFFKKVTDNGYEVVALNGEVKQVGNVSNLFFGKNSVLAVKNLFGEGTNPLMLALMMGDNKDGGIDMKTFALMSMMGGSAGAGDNNMMLMALMLSK